jgi:uncharacterized protein
MILALISRPMKWNEGGKIMNEHGKINYVELPAQDIGVAKTFFAAVFGWSFVDYGPKYTAFSNAGIDGGFFKSDLRVSTDNGSALIIFYSSELEQTQSEIEKAGGSIIRPIFSFPGGRRFHFGDPNGNEYAVWSDIPAGDG